MIDHLVADGNLQATQSDQLRAVLNLPHIHQYQKEFIRELHFGTTHKLFKNEENLNLEEGQQAEEEKPKDRARANSLNSCMLT